MAGTGAISSGGLVDFAASLYGTDDDPMGATVMRDGVWHGLHHAADSMAQVRVNFMGLDDDVVEGQDQFGTTETIGSVLDYYLVGGSPFGEWPLTLRADGTAYKLRIRIAGSISATIAAATFRVVIGPSRPLRNAEVLEPLDSIYEVEFTTATPTWGTGAAQGSTASATILTVSSRQVREWITDTPIYDAVSSPAGGRTIEQCMVAAHVYVNMNNTARLPRLNALHISEYLG